MQGIFILVCFLIWQQKTDNMRTFILFIALFSSAVSFSQNGKNDLGIFAGASLQPVFNEQLISANLSGKYYLTNTFSLGAQLLYTNKKSSFGYGYDTDRTLQHVFTFNVPLQYDIVANDKVNIGLGFSNGVLLTTLRNRNETKDHEYYDADTGITTVVHVPVRLNRDAYYVLTPNLDFSYKLLRMDEDSSMFLTGNVGYQMAFGRGDFTKMRDFTNYVVSLGITFKGTLD